MLLQLEPSDEIPALADELRALESLCFCTLLLPLLCISLHLDKTITPCISEGPSREAEGTPTIELKGDADRAKGTQGLVAAGNHYHPRPRRARGMNGDARV